MLRLPARFDGSPKASPRDGDAREESLVARIAGGEAIAFDELYRCYHPRLRRFIDRLTRRAELVDEIVDDTMMVVWNRADRYDGSSKVSTWIFAIAYRKALKALARVDDPVDDADVQDVATSAPGPEEDAERGQLRRAIVKALEGLSEVQRAVVDLTYFHDIGYAEIARIVDCPVDTVKTRMFHARRRLRVLLAGRSGDWP